MRFQKEIRTMAQQAGAIRAQTDARKGKSRQVDPQPRSADDLLTMVHEAAASLRCKPVWQKLTAGERIKALGLYGPLYFEAYAAEAERHGRVTYA